MFIWKKIGFLDISKKIYEILLYATHLQFILKKDL